MAENIERKGDGDASAARVSFSCSVLKAIVRRWSGRIEARIGLRMMPPFGCIIRRTGLDQTNADGRVLTQPR
jgi:hypothetical protein